MFSYKAGHFSDKTRRQKFPYRVKYAKEPGQPLLVFFHGAGAAGTDNLRPLWEYLFGPYPELFPLLKRKDLLKRDITVLIPQMDLLHGYRDPEYVYAVKELAGQLAEQTGADTDRIYCAGHSRGGACAWLSAYLFPDFYACAMPLMGSLYHPELPSSLTTEALTHMKDLPIWVAHSADDTVASVERDDETVAVLRSLGAPVKYTRIDGKGHNRLVSYFLKTEPYGEWMFSQKRK